MYKEVLTSMESVEIYPVISFVLFFCFFTFLLFMVWRSDKSLMTKLSSLPLEANDMETTKHSCISSQEKKSFNHD